MAVTIGQVIALIKALGGGGGGGGGGVSDVKVNGTSVVTSGVANIPFGKDFELGLVKARKWATRTNAKGVYIEDSGEIGIISANDSEIKAGVTNGRCITPGIQSLSVFFGMATAAGDTTQKNSSNAVGTYTESAKSAISDMLNAPETVSGTTPTITAKSGVRYICGECSTLDITVPASGCIDVTFTSGSTPTVLTVPNTVIFPAWFDADNLDADTTYEINILDGVYAAVMSWPYEAVSA